MESGVLDANPDADGCVEIDLDKVVEYIVKEAHKDEIGDYNPEEIFFIVQGEMEYAEEVGSYACCRTSAEWVEMASRCQTSVICLSPFSFFMRS